MGAYSSLLVPGAIALVLLVVLLKVVHAIVRIVAVAVLLLVLAGGYLLYGRVAAIQQAVSTASHQVNTGMTSANNLQHSIQSALRGALQAVGLNPDYLQVRVTCAGNATQVRIRYDDHNALFGLLSHQDFTVPLPSGVGCTT